jgi:uncharacterized RDD family membrane protein YckC
MGLRRNSRWAAARLPRARHLRPCERFPAVSGLHRSERAASRHQAAGRAFAEPDPALLESFFGFPFRNEIALVEEREIGMLTAERVVTTRRSVTYVVGPDLRPVDAFDLDSILSLAYLAYVVTAQGLYGATVGKRLLRLRVVDRYGVRPGLGAAAIRNLVLNGPILVGLALYALMEWTSFGSLTLLLWLAAVLALCNLAIAVEVWLTARKGKPSLHDRLAGTRVVRLPRPADPRVG